MPLSGNQLIDKAVLASGGKKITEARALQHIIDDKQSTHIKEAEESVFNSTVLLHKLYKTRLETEKQKILKEIKQYIETLPEPDINEALLAFARVESYSIDKDGHPHPYGLLQSQRKLSLTIIDILVLAWIGATDPNAIENVTLTPKDTEDRKLSVINAMRKANNEYGPNNPSCYGGMFHALIFSLSGVHRCVLIVLDKQLALVDVKTGFKHQVKSFFDVKQFSDELDDELSDEKKEMPAQTKDILRTDEEKESILRAWGLDEPDNAEAEKFIEEAKIRIKKYLLKRYKKIIPEDEIDDLLPTIEYMAKVDLINPNIHAQITKKAMEIFNKLSPREKQQIFETWENENKDENSSAEKFISEVMQEFLQSPEFESSRGFLDLNELENIQRSVIQLKKTDFGIVMQNTVEEDQALKSHPNWFSNRKANTLALVANEYTQPDYGNVLKKLLEMVSAEAVAVAAIEPDSYGNNAVMYAAAKQDSENFLALINKLLETPNGEKALLQSMSQVNKTGYNLLMLVALNKKEGFTDFINKLFKINGGVEALLSSMAQIATIQPHYNAAMLMAEHQSSENFIFFINKMFSLDERGPASIIKSMQTFPKSNLLMVTATHQKQGGLIVLLDKIENTPGGREAFLQSLSTKKGIVTNSKNYNALMLAARYQTRGGLAALSKKVVSMGSPALFLELITKTVDERMPGPNSYVEKYNSLMFVMKYQTSEEAIAFLDLLLSINAGPFTFLELMGKVGTYIDGPIGEKNYNALMLAAQFQTKGGFVALITKLSTLPGGPEVFLKSMKQSGYRFRGFQSANVLLLAAQYQTPENFMIFINELLNLKIQLKSSSYQGVATFMDMRTSFMGAIEEIVRVTKFASLVGLIRVCMQHDIDAFPFIMKAIDKKSHRLTDVERVLISSRDASLFTQDLSLLANSEMKVPEEKEVKVHLPVSEETINEVQRALNNEPIDMAMQTELLASFSVLKKTPVTASVSDTHSEAEQLKDQLKSKMERLQAVLDSEDPSLPAYQIIQKIFLKVRAVVEEKEGKPEDVNSLFTLEEEIDKDLKHTAKKNSPQLFSSSPSAESISEKPLTLESMPPVIQEVISLINNFKKNHATLNTGVKYKLTSRGIPE